MYVTHSFVNVKLPLLKVFKTELNCTPYPSNSKTMIYFSNSTLSAENILGNFLPLEKSSVKAQHRMANKKKSSNHQ